MQIKDKSTWAAWITKRYDEWRVGKYGNAASIAEFARQFGASHQVVLNWMRADSTPPRAAKYINALAVVYGDDAYYALGLVKPDEELTSLDHLEPGDREALLSAFEEAGLPVNSDEDLERVIKALVSRGMKVTRIR